MKTRREIELEKDKLHKIELSKVTLQLNEAIKIADDLAKVADFHGGAGKKGGDTSAVATKSAGIKYSPAE